MHSAHCNVQECLLALQRARFLQSTNEAADTAELLERRAVTGMQRVAEFVPLHTKQAADLRR